MMIDLETTNLILKETVDPNWEPMVDTFFKGKWSKVCDFGTILINHDVDDPFVKEVCSLTNENKSPVFVAPDTWRMAHVMKALGAFKSATEASKNGWAMEIPIGLSEHFIRLNKVQGSITIFKGKQNG